MGLRFAAARGISAILTFGLRKIAHSPALNTPGKIALYVDPNLIADLRPKISGPTAVVVGTNGKTTISNLVPIALERSGIKTACNFSGANLDSGIATTLLQTKGAQAGVFECDELWTTKVVPLLRPTYFLLLNLFRDQLDRCGEIDVIQDAIVSSLKQSPDTILIYNADDPLCEIIARRVDNKTIKFGVAEDMHLAQNEVVDASMCQACSHMFDYDYRQYGQLGAYVCPNCGFARPALDVHASDIDLGQDTLTFTITENNNLNAEGVAVADGTVAGSEATRLSVPFAVSYMVYNMLATFVLAREMGATHDKIQEAINNFNPQNGRLQQLKIEGHDVLLNLAKNPTGFNQNLRIALKSIKDAQQVQGDAVATPTFAASPSASLSAAAPTPAVAFFVNDREADGRDISWIWDIDFEELAGSRVKVFTGGIRKLDLALRLKYAGLEPIIVDDVKQAFAQLDPGAAFSVIANYTALPGVKADLEAMSKNQVGQSHDAAREVLDAQVREATTSQSPANRQLSASPQLQGVMQASAQKITIAHILPDLLNLYGDGGNVRVLATRARARGIEVNVKRITFDDPIDLHDVDLVVMGGAPDREQRLANQKLTPARDEIAAYVEQGGALLAICGGYQMLGRTWILENEEVPGLSILPVETRRPGEGKNTDRMVGNIALSSALATHPVVGYENHAGRTYLDATARPFGKVTSKHGFGNNDVDIVRADGVVYKNAIGTYLHGPLLPKNPEIADWLLARALEHAAARDAQSNKSEKGAEVMQAALAPDISALAPLDDALEYKANDYMAKRLM